MRCLHNTNDRTLMRHHTIIHDNITCLEATHEVVKPWRGDIDDVSDVIKVGEVELQFLPELSLTLR